MAKERGGRGDKNINISVILASQDIYLHILIYFLLPLLQLLTKSEVLYEEISSVFQSIEQKCTYLENESSARNELHNHMVEFKEQLINERNNYKVSDHVHTIYQIMVTW